MLRPIATTVAVALLVGCSSTKSGPPPSVTSRVPVRSAADIHCSLPIVTGTQAGFIDFPSGVFRIDHNAPDPQANFGLTYSFGARHWVTTLYSFGYQLLSPDGRSFVQAYRPLSSNSASTDIYLVDVVTRARKKIGSIPTGARVIAYQPDGIYLDGLSIYRFDPTTGRSVELGPRPPLVSDTSLWFWVTRGYVWNSLIAGPNQVDANPVLSMSVADGAVTRWYTAPATRSVSILGFLTPSEPLVAEYNREPYDRMTGVLFMLLSEPGVARVVTLDSSIIAWGLTDSFGIWMESPGHVWLYNATGLVSMADVSNAIGSAVPGVAGPCR